jgi:broad specificity phosphatase PhoE
MSQLRRIVLVRHGETVGNSKERFHGSSDLALSDEGRAQMRRVAHALGGEVFDVVVASPLRRSWESAQIVAGGAPVRLEDAFREIHFGRWEGMTAEEIQAADPSAYQEWQSRAPGFEFPSGERRADFRERVAAGLARLEQSGATGALLVVHKGVIRAIAEQLLGQPLEDGVPGLGESVSLTRAANGGWFLGERGSDPEGLEAA